MTREEKIAKLYELFDDYNHANSMYMDAFNDWFSVSAPPTRPVSPEMKEWSSKILDAEQLLESFLSEIIPYDS